jgi:DNA-binding response OmpR family regulator
VTKKILVIDDDEGIVDALEVFLVTSGFEVKTTRKGEEAQSLITEYKPDLILLDVLMSGIDGRNICKTIKADRGFRSIPIVMISAHPSAAKTIFESGADAFLAKPFETQELLSLIARHTQ